MRRIHLVISGDVQGVGYRAWVLRYAQDKLLTGWVKNRDDGTVELVAEGARENLEELIKRCQEGPDVSFVEKVETVWEDATNEFVTFAVVY